MISIISLILSFFSIRGFRYLLTDDGLTAVNTESFFWLLLFLFFAAVFSRAMHDPDRRLKGYSILFGVLIALFYVLGVSFEKMGTLSRMWENAEAAGNYLNLFFSYAALYFCFSYSAFRFLSDNAGTGTVPLKKKFSFKTVLLFWGLLLIFYIPWYMFCYPGILTPDSDDQIRQALSLKELSSHHSVLLTMLIRVIMSAAKALTGSLQAGIGACSLLQMLAMTFIFACAYARIRCRLKQPVIRLLAFLWYALYPVHAIYSVTMWKDILFSGSVLVLMLCLDAAVENEAGFFSSGWRKLILFLTLLLLPLMRHNGILITALTVICMLFRFPTFRSQLMIMGISLVLLLGIWNFLILPGMHVESVESGLGLSVLEQQIARTLLLHHDELSDYEVSSLEEYFNVPEIWGRYNPRLSDPVKHRFREDVFARNPRRFFALWARLGMRYPLDYAEAFLHNNYGYWFPEINSSVSTVYNAYVQQRYLKEPVLPLLFSPGACFWVWLFCGIFCLYRNRKKLILSLPGFALWLSVLISPMYGEMRYVYGLFIGLPLLLSAALTAESGDTDIPSVR